MIRVPSIRNYRGSTVASFATKGLFRETKPLVNGERAQPPGETGVQSGRKEPHKKGAANHLDRESSAGRREAPGEM